MDYFKTPIRSRYQRDPEYAERIKEKHRKKYRETHDVKPKFPDEKKQEIVELRGRGVTYREIGEKMGMSIALVRYYYIRSANTVKKHIKYD